LAPTKYLRRQNIGAEKYWRWQKLLASTKFPHRQNHSLDEISASTKSRCRQNVGADAEESPYCLAWHSPQLLTQTSLKISYVSLTVLISLHALPKCGVASGCPAFMGGLSPVPYRLAVPVHHAENITNFGADKISASALISPFFTEL
jgi:hypothetical protein